MTTSIGIVSEFGGRLEDVNKFLKTTADRDTSILSMFLHLNEPVKAMKAEWVDKALVGFKDTVKTALTTSTGTTITVSGGTNAPKRYIAGVTLLEIEDEVVLVASIISTITNETTLNITRAQLSTTAASHAAGKEVVIIGNPRDEGFSAGRNDSQAGNRAYNMTQIFERQLKLSGSSQEISSVSQETLVANQVDELTPELLKEMQHAFFYGRRYDGGSDYTGRRMGGLKYWCAVANGGANNVDKGGNALGFNDIDDIIETYLGNGGDANKLVMFVPVRQQRKLNDLKEARIVGGGMTQAENALNNFVTRYDFGSRGQVEVILSTDLRKDEIYFAQKDKLSVHPLGSRTLKVNDLPNDGDFVRKMLLSEMTLIARNTRETLFRVYNLAT